MVIHWTQLNLITIWWYHSVIIISFVLAQGDHNNRLLLCIYLIWKVLIRPECQLPRRQTSIYKTLTFVLAPSLTCLQIQRSLNIGPWICMKTVEILLFCLYQVHGRMYRHAPINDFLTIYIFVSFTSWHFFNFFLRTNEIWKKYIIFVLILNCKYSNNSKWLRRIVGNDCAKFSYARSYDARLAHNTPYGDGYR